MSNSGPVTVLLLRWRGGDPAAREQLFPLIYEELRRLAGAYMRGERPGHTLQATALVHEAFLRLVDMDVAWEDRAHFLSVAARAMRRILVDHARSKRSAKRGGGEHPLPLDEVQVGSEPDPGLVELDEALDRLARVDARKAQVVELHHFGGLNHEEMAGVLGVSPTTVQRDLRAGRAWLRRELSGA